MEQTPDYYNILQVHHDAEKDVIDAAYRCLSKIYHPDMNKSPVASERMKDINVAYQVIGNEAARKEYHKQWMQKNAWKTLSEWGSTGWRATENRETFSAFAMLDSFFRETLNEKWEPAYARLTADDRMNVAFDDFLEWKRAVHSIYRLGNYHISYFRRYSDCRYNNKAYPKIYHFIVRVTELQLATGQIVESSSHKYVALEDGALRVCLGNKDLKPATEKFRRLAQMSSKTGFDQFFASAVDRIDMGTGMLARAGWIEEAEREMERSRRYGSSFCMGVMGFAPRLTAAGNLHGEETLEKNMAYISSFIKERVRKTDVIGRCSDLSLALLFPEVRPRGGRKALEKLASLLRRDEYIKNNFPCQISAAIKSVKAPVEDELDTLMRKIGIERPIKAE